MTGIVNSTGARSGIIGTTVGTPAAAGITEADIWRVTPAYAEGNINPIINWERADTYGAGLLGTGMTETSTNSGIFVFPSEGLWLIHFSGMVRRSGNSSWVSFTLHWAADETTFNGTAEALTFIQETDSVQTYANAPGSQILDVTDITQQRVKFSVEYRTSGSSYLIGNTSTNQTCASFIRLGDT